MTSKLKLTGAGLSPFVRKVRAALAEKGLAYEHDPMVPFGVPAEYRKKHPLGKVPLLEVDGRPLPDSSVICFYLERIQPQPALYPSEPFEQARALWLEEFSDAALMPAVGPFFQQRVLTPLFFKKPGDEALVEKAAKETLPPLFDYLEAQLGGNDYLVGNRFTIADLSVGSVFVNYQHGKGTVDAKRWPAIAAYVERVHSRPSFKGLIEEDRRSLAQLGG
jgi:glutathione S-transferase